MRGRLATGTSSPARSDHSAGSSRTSIPSMRTHAHSDRTGFAERARTDAYATIRIHRADEAMARTGKPPAKNLTRPAPQIPPATRGLPLFPLIPRKGLKILSNPRFLHFQQRQNPQPPPPPRRPRPPPHRGHLRGSPPQTPAHPRHGRFSLPTRNPLTGRTGPQIPPDGLNPDSSRRCGPSSLAPLGSRPGPTVTGSLSKGSRGRYPQLSVRTDRADRRARRSRARSSRRPGSRHPSSSRPTGSIRRRRP